LRFSVTAFANLPKLSIIFYKKVKDKNRKRPELILIHDPNADPVPEDERRVCPSFPVSLTSKF